MTLHLDEAAAGAAAEDPYRGLEASAQKPEAQEKDPCLILGVALEWRVTCGARVQLLRVALTEAKWLWRGISMEGAMMTELLTA